ncbi:MAG: ribosomal-processing cysteine protease Prp, partial [Lachnospiraceae bacterium]|nr:ribosomal-processing cysteine protease Prp [Lachnospiraceae bacterium]
MITVTVRRREGSYISLSSEGHAGYADRGEDILC